MASSNPQRNLTRREINRLRNSVIDQEMKAREGHVQKFKEIVEDHLDTIQWSELVQKNTKNDFTFGIRNVGDAKRALRNNLYDLGHIGPYDDADYRLYCSVKNDVEDLIIESEKYPITSIVAEETTRSFDDVWGCYFILKCGI